MLGAMLNADLDGIDSTVNGVSTVANAAYPASNPAGYITAAAIPAPYVLPTASTTVLGGVKVDGTTVTVAGGGVISAAGAVAVSAIAPSSPVAGSLWFDTNGGQMYVWYNDGNSSQWVPVVNQGYAPSSSLFIKPPIASLWTARNSVIITDVTTGVQASSAGSLTLDALYWATQLVPATPYNIDINLSVIGTCIGGQNIISAVGWMDGTKYQAFKIYSPAVSAVFWAAQGYSTFSSVTSNFVTAVNTSLGLSNFWVRLSDNGTNISFAISGDGYTYQTVYTIAKASGFLGSSGYTNVGWGPDNAVGTGATAPIVTMRSWLVH